MFSNALSNVLGGFGQALTKGRRGQRCENVVGTVLGTLTIASAEVADLRCTLCGVEGYASASPTIYAGLVAGLAGCAELLVNLHHESFSVISESLGWTGTYAGPVFAVLADYWYVYRSGVELEDFDATRLRVQLSLMLDDADLLADTATSASREGTVDDYLHGSG